MDFATECYGKPYKARIADCIKSHKGKYPGFDFEPESLEARVVHNADIIEKTGWIGVLQGVRTFAEFGATGLDNYQGNRSRVQSSEVQRSTLNGEP